MTKVDVNVPGGRYDVLIGTGLLEKTGELVKSAVSSQTAAVITDDITDRLYADVVEDSLKAAGFKTVRYVFPNGEKSKNTDTYIDMLNFLADSRLTRTDAVIALGGGVTGDMAGFAAATYLRGIKLIQIPTTLLADVDSSVGGKTAIDLKSGKNQAGAFYQPNLVICDHGTLSTLPDSVFSDGCAEVIKYGMIRDRELFDMLSTHVREQPEEIISRCVSIKRDVVVKDEKDSSIRQILNFGHTFGHGVEKRSGYNIPHGSAVAIGMAIITKACVKLKLCPEYCYDRLCATLEKYNLPTRTSYTAEDLFEAVMSDKKRAGGDITLVLLNDIGSVTLKKMPVSQAEDFLTLGLGD